MPHYERSSRIPFCRADGPSVQTVDQHTPSKHPQAVPGGFFDPLKACPMSDSQKPQQTPIQARVADTLTRLNLTDTQGAQYLGVPVHTLRKWLNGTRAPNAAAVRLLDVLGTIETLAPDIHEHLMP